MEKVMQNDVVRLLRFLGKTTCRATTGHGAEQPARLERPGSGQSLSVPAHVIRAAAESGLVVCRGEAISATDACRSFLRRYLAAREESFLDQHRTIEIAEIVEDKVTRPVRVNAAESPLALLARLKDRAGMAWFPGDALSAGSRLARDFQYAALQPRLTQSYEPRLGDRVRAAPGAGVEMKDSVAAARARVRHAIEAMGPELSGVALDVCCFEKGLEVVERERQWPARSAKLMLKTALLSLHRHYHPKPVKIRQRHAWADEGYRPDFAGEVARR